MTWVMRIVDVVHDHAEVVGRGAVGADEDPVVELLVLERDGAVDEVVHDGGAGVGDAQAQGAGGEPAVAAAAGVAEGLLARLGRLALGVELLGRAVAVVRAARLHQPRGVPPGRARSARSDGSRAPAAPRPSRGRASVSASTMSSMFSSVERERSVSSMRRMKTPPWWRANSQLKSAVRAPPTCRCPVGLGANRTRISRLIARAPPAPPRSAVSCPIILRPDERQAEERPRGTRGSPGAISAGRG